MNDEIYTGVLKASEELKHYGVLGMKWGVRKNPDKAYSKSIKKLQKIEKAQQKASTDRAKIKAMNYQKRIAKLEKRTSSAAQKSAKLSRKSAALEIKSRKLGARSDKLETRSNKARASAARAWTLKSYNRRLRRSDRLHAKSEKLGIKSERLGVKSQDVGLKAQLYSAKSKKYTRKIADLNYKQAKNESRAAKMDLKDKKLQAKGQKWVNAMNKEFANKTLSSVSAEDIAYGKKWAIEIASRTKVKHDWLAGETFTGTPPTFEELMHYGVKGMKWGVVNKKKTGTKTFSSSGSKSKPTESTGGGVVTVLDGKDKYAMMDVIEELGLSDYIKVDYDFDAKKSLLRYKDETYLATDKNLKLILSKIMADTPNVKSLRSREKNIDNSKSASVKKRKSVLTTPAAGSTEEAVKNSPNSRKAIQTAQIRKNEALKTLASIHDPLKKRRKKS